MLSLRLPFDIFSPTQSKWKKPTQIQRIYDLLQKAAKDQHPTNKIQTNRETNQTKEIKPNVLKAKSLPWSLWTRCSASLTTDCRSFKVASASCALCSNCKVLCRKASRIWAIRYRITKTFEHLFFKHNHFISRPLCLLGLLEPTRFI